MQKKLELKLITDFPKLYEHMYGKQQNTGLSFGIECDDGWFNLIYNLSKNIQIEINKNIEQNSNTCRIEQIKEKFGNLRFYTSGWTNKNIHSLIMKTTEDCKFICDQCGQPGKINTNGWYKVRCKKHKLTSLKEN